MSEPHAVNLHVRICAGASREGGPRDSPTRFSAFGFRVGNLQRETSQTNPANRAAIRASIETDGEGEVTRIQLNGPAYNNHTILDFAKKKDRNTADRP